MFRRLISDPLHSCVKKNYSQRWNKSNDIACGDILLINHFIEAEN